MDEDRLVEHLRTIERPSEPDRRFVDRLYDQLASELELAATTTLRRSPENPDPATRSRRVAWLVAAAALVILIVGSVVVGGSFLARQHRTSTLLEAVRASGTLRIAVRPDTPQVPPPGAFGGFDYDVALRVGRPSWPARRGNEDPSNGHAQARLRGWLGSACPDCPPLGPRPVRLQEYGRSTCWSPPPAARSVADLQGATVCVVAGTVGSRGDRHADRRRRARGGCPAVRRPPPVDDR